MKLFLCLFCIATALCFANAPRKCTHRNDRAAYVSKLIKPGDIGAEIGVCEGSFSYHVLLQKKPSKLYLIDPWEYGLRKNIEKEPTPEKQRYRDEQYKRVCNYFAPFENVEILRMKSEDAVYLFADDYFDYVYIDGEHSYEAVTRDLNNYFPKVKVGGCLIGDDYGWTGIAPAVHDFLKAHKGQCSFRADEGSGSQFVIQRLK
jgi:hypothetical protein